MAAYGSLDAHQITVGPQDRIDSIATSLSCSIDDFAGCNPGVDLYNLCPGQVIVIPCNAVVPEHGCHPQHGSGYGEQHDTSYGYGHGDNQYSHTCGCHDGAPSQEEYVSQLHTARALFENAIKEHFNGPELLRCAFHDAGTHDMHTGQFGADGSLRFEREMNEPHNKGIHETVDIIYGIKEHVPLVSFADLFQLGAAVAVELAGGPAMPIRYGRVDCGQEGIPHQVMIPSPSTDNPVEEIRDKMYRMGFNDQDIVAIMGGHTYGRVHLENSGFGVEETVYTKNGPGEKGGTSWTEDWLKFTNTYYIELLKHDSHDRRGPNMLITLPTDVALLQVSEWSQWVQVYAQDQERWWQDYSEAHTKMSEFGATWMHGQPISM